MHILSTYEWFLCLLYLGLKKNDICCEPIRTVDAWQLHHLLEASNFVRKWYDSGKNCALTAETTLAIELTFKSVALLAQHLIESQRMDCVLLGKFGSDPLEKRFGWFRQLSGANFYISVKQLLEAEKKIRILGLIKSGNLSMTVHQQNNDIKESMTMLSTSASSDGNENNDDVKLSLTFIPELVLSDIDQATVYSVAGYAGKLK